MKYSMTRLAVVALALTVTLPGLANAQTVPSGPSGNSNNGHLYIFEKDASWVIVPGGAWGKMLFNKTGPTLDFVFNGHRLNPGWAYTLIYYPDYAGDPWPRLNILCLGSGTADVLGDVPIKGSVTVPGGTLPIADDLNTSSGAKVWLVLPADVNCVTRTMSGWTPADYLFEYNLFLTYTYSP